MIDREWCNHGGCAECTSPCLIDERIPCSPDCSNLTPEGKIVLSNCIEVGCDAFYCLLPPEAETKTAEELLILYGKTIDIPDLGM